MLDRESRAVVTKTMPLPLVGASVETAKICAHLALDDQRVWIVKRETGRGVGRVVVVDVGGGHRRGDPAQGVRFVIVAAANHLPFRTRVVANDCAAPRRDETRSTAA